MGPVAVSIDAGSLAFQLYNGNHVIDDEHENCGDDLNHAVTVVGYNEDDPSNPYWIMRNSWGEDWGDKGYAYIKIVPGEGVCGIQMEPTYPNVYLLKKSASRICYVVLSILGGAIIAPLFIIMLRIKQEADGLLFFHPG